MKLSAYIPTLTCLLLVTAILPAPRALLAQSSGQTDFITINPKQNSPLSRFGLGDPLDQVHAAAAGMGALQSTYQDPFHLNLLNPASLANLQAASLEVGTYIRYSTIEDANNEANAWQGNLRYLALGFPLRNQINMSLDRSYNTWNAGMAFSLAPTTLVGYDLEVEGNDEVFGTTFNQLRGTGGAYRFSWSTAGRYRGLSVGANVNYNFGKITNSRIVAFREVPESLASEFVEEFNLSGFSLGYGLQYAYNFKSANEEGERVANGKRLIFGINGTLGADVDTEANLLFRRFSPDDRLFVRDTLLSESDQAGILTLPSNVTFGVAFEDFNRLFIGAEYGLANYSEFRNDAQPDELLDANRLAVGFQFIPNANSYNDYWKRVRYRLGVRLEDDPRQVDGVQLRRNAVTLGFGLPIRLPRQQVSFFDLALEYGKFGAPGVIDENYFQMTLGVSLNDNTWFFKRKLN